MHTNNVMYENHYSFKQKYLYIDLDIDGYCKRTNFKRKEKKITDN